MMRFSKGMLGYDQNNMVWEKEEDGSWTQVCDNMTGKHRTVDEHKDSNVFPLPVYPIDISEDPSVYRPEVDAMDKIKKRLDALEALVGDQSLPSSKKKFAPYAQMVRSLKSLAGELYKADNLEILFKINSCLYSKYPTEHKEGDSDGS